MFCRLWKVQTETGLKFEGINKKCNKEGICNHVKKINKKLDSSNFGWRCSEVIFLEKNPKEIQDYKFCLNLIHPIHDDLYIFIDLDDNPFRFKIVSKGRNIESRGLGNLNEKLKQIFPYDGDWLTEEFILKCQK